MNKEQIEDADRGLLSSVLRGGVLLSSSVIAFGLLLFVLSGQGGYAADQTGGNGRYTAFRGEVGAGGPVYFPTTPVEIGQGVLGLKPFAIIMMGLLLLAVTPVINVALAGIMYWRRGNATFGLISLFVLTVLIVSFLLGKAGG